MREYIFDFIVSLAMFLWGFAWGKRNRPAPAEKDASICSCKHAYSMHNDDGTCNVAKVKFEYGAYKSYTCPCIRYDGIPPAHIYMKDS